MIASRSTAGDSAPPASEGPPTLGLILAGGLARRMGGGDKGLRRVGGRTLLERAIERLRPQCAGLLLNANGDPARLAPLGVPVVADGIPDFAGPLAGILAGLDWAALHRPDLDWVASVGADTPFLPRDFVARLHAARQEAGARLATAASGGRTHPVNGLWPVSMREDLREALIGSGLRKVGAWTSSQGAASAVWADQPYDPFFNANTPEDLAEAEAIARLADGA